MEDIAELARLMSLTQNPRVRTMLSGCINDLKKADHGEDHKRHRTQSPASTSPVPAAKPAATPPAMPVPMATSAPAAAPVDKREFETISTFSWEQSETEVKVLVPCVGVSNDMVTADFRANAFEIKVVGLHGKNYRCAVAPLFKAVDPSKCSFMVPKSQKRVVVKLAKASSSSWDERSWSELKEKPSLVKPPASDDKDPTAGIMDMMKNLYNEGDDEMKRTIAKAWTQQQDGKSPLDNMDDDLKMPPMPPMPDMGGMGDLSKMMGDLPKL